MSKWLPQYPEMGSGLDKPPLHRTSWSFSDLHQLNSCPGFCGPATQYRFQEGGWKPHQTCPHPGLPILPSPNFNPLANPSHLLHLLILAFLQLHIEHTTRAPLMIGTNCFMTVSASRSAAPATADPFRTEPFVLYCTECLYATFQQEMFTDLCT